MLANMTIQEASLEEIVAINSKIPEFSNTIVKEEFEERLKGKNSLLITSKKAGISVGYLIGYDRYEDGSFYCWMTGVHPNYRQKGILTGMMKYEDTWAKENGYTHIKIKTQNDRREMLLALINAGFDIIGFEPNKEYSKNKILLQKDL
jgi:predicted GNAT superfamily acetyltransferase